MQLKYIGLGTLLLSIEFFGCGETPETSSVSQVPQLESPAVDTVCAHPVELGLTPLEACRENYGHFKRTWSRATWTRFAECIEGVKDRNGEGRCVSQAESGKLPPEDRDHVPEGYPGVPVLTVCDQIIQLARQTDGPEMTPSECLEELSPLRGEMTETQWSDFQGCVESATHWRDIDDCATAAEDSVENADR